MGKSYVLKCKALQNIWQKASNGEKSNLYLAFSDSYFFGFLGEKTTPIFGDLRFTILFKDG